jgi:hypothetical protein
MQMGIANLPAPPLRDVRWIDGEGREIEKLSLEDLGSGYRILFFFQHACPGCHAHGFPTLARLVEQLSGADVSFAAIQTAFEDLGANAFERIREDQQRYGLRIPFGHAAPEFGNSIPSVMADYRTGGTPWYVGIAPDNRVLFDGFQLDAEALISALSPLIPFSK